MEQVNEAKSRHQETMPSLAKWTNVSFPKGRVGRRSRQHHALRARSEEIVTVCATHYISGIRTLQAVDQVPGHSKIGFQHDSQDRTGEVANVIWIADKDLDLILSYLLRTKFSSKMWATLDGLPVLNQPLL